VFLFLFFLSASINNKDLLSVSLLHLAKNKENLYLFTAPTGMCPFHGKWLYGDAFHSLEKCVF